MRKKRQHYYSTFWVGIVKKQNKKFHTSSNSPSALTTVNVFLGVLSSKCGGEYPGALAGILGLEWSGWFESLIKGLDSTSGDYKYFK